MAESIVFTNGLIYSPTGLKSWMKIEANRIVAIGNNSLPPGDRFVDLQGRLILPGMIDSHIHIYSQGRFSSRLNLKKIGSISELQNKLEQYGKKRDEQWLIGGGWDQDYMEDKRYPNREDLDLIVRDRAVLLYRGCNHIGVVNSKALEIMGITRKTVNPEGGKIDRDENGEPTGILREEALSLVTPYIRDIDEDQRMEYFTRGLEECLSTGITAVQTNDARAWQYYKELAVSGRLPIRVFLTVPFDELDQKETPARGEQIGLLRCDRVKLFADGSLGAETAALREPYAGTKNTGIPIHSPDDLVSKVQKIKEQGYRAEVHAIGDYAAEIVLDAFEKVGMTTADRPVLTHCQILGDDLIKRMRDLGVIANIQPPFVNTDAKWVDLRLGAGERRKYAYAWKTLLEEQIICAGGSDAPIESPDPMYGIYCAITRLDSDGEEWRPEEKLTFEEAVSLYTNGGAYAAEMETQLGKLERGYLADFIIVDPKIVDTSEQLLNRPVYAVWVDGQEKFTR